MYSYYGDEEMVKERMRHIEMGLFEGLTEMVRGYKAQNLRKGEIVKIIMNMYTVE